MQLTKTQLHILQHSLGVDDYGRGKQYRNHFVTGPVSHDFNDCRALSEAGLMKDHGADKMLCGGSHCFTVTPEGKDAVAKQSPVPPKISRSKQRYRDWLKSVDAHGYSFGDWLKLPKQTL